MSGRLIGIARHDRPKGPMESLAAAVIVPGEGIHGDFRGALKSGRNRREVTVMTHEDWTQAAVEANATHIDWFERRANLLVEGVMLPREPGATIHLSGGVVLEVTGETAPYFVEWVRQQLDAQFGKQLYEQGLKVTRLSISTSRTRRSERWNARYAQSKPAVSDRTSTRRSSTTLRTAKVTWEAARLRTCRARSSRSIRATARCG